MRRRQSTSLSRMASGAQPQLSAHACSLHAAELLVPRAAAHAPDSPLDAIITLRRGQLREMQVENGNLKQELAAFDPAFWEELEDLKHSHHCLQEKCASYVARFGPVPA